MAAGMGKRFGGLKQLAPLGPAGEVAMDYSVHHALKAGFSGVVVVVRCEIAEAIAEHARSSWPPSVSFALVRQDLDGASMLAGKDPRRSKPLGTGHAVLAARELLGGDFTVVNADDLYGERAFSLLHEHLSSASVSHALVGFRLDESFVGSGPVTRAMCSCDEDGTLRTIDERTVWRTERGYEVGNARATERGVADGRAPVSMNMWGFRSSVFGYLEDALERLLQRGDPDAELLLPEVVGEMIERGERVSILPSAGRCLGVTRAEDVSIIRGEVEAMVRSGEYPEVLWAEDGR